MLDPKKLKTGQSIQLKQIQGGKWQEWLIDKDGRVIVVEDIDPFKYSKEKTKEPDNYEELKKNYKYSSEIDQSPPSIEINDDLSPPHELPNCEPDDPEIEEEPETPLEDREKEEDRECEVKEENPDTEEN